MDKFGKWTFALALGLPAVSGAAMAGLAFLQGVSPAYFFALVLLAIATTATAMNQLRPVLIANAVYGKLQITDLHVRLGRLEDGNTAYTVLFVMHNRADFDLEYVVKRSVAHLEGRVVPTDKVETVGAVIPAFRPGGHVIGHLPMPARISGAIAGDLEAIVDYGKPGKSRFQLIENYRFVVSTDETGNVVDVTRFHKKA